MGTVLVLGGALTLADDGGDQTTSTAPENTPSTPPPSAQQEPTTSFTGPSASPARGVPRLLTVPHLGIQSTVRRIATSGGVLTPPEDAREVGWDVASAAVGSAYGSSIITGHTVHTGGGALDELDDLDVGDKVMVTTDKGRIRYVVSSVSEFTKQEMVKAIPRLYSGDVPGRLVLITCTDWNGVDYDANTVVFARPDAGTL
ncbi:MAG TPA: class F sortase [Nocardioidaceae bacterium]|nr:class F sortase [Nocardioidaceae bacterium]